MKIFIFALLILGISQARADSGQHTGTFTVTGIGASNRTDSVYINTAESAENTSCKNNKHFKLSDKDKLADKFYHGALLAFTQNKKMHIMYNDEDCIDDSVVPIAFLIE